VTHVLLPVGLLARRRDEAAVIGAALLAAARGWGFRRIAAELGRCPDTVLGWLRRFTGSARRVRAVFTGLLIAVDPDPPPLVPAGSVLADAVTAILACCQAVAARWQVTELPELSGVSMVTPLSPWTLACAVTDGTLLAPDVAARTINTSSPLPITGY
jgi:hypothetical protein